MITGFFVAIPVFFDVAFIILVPIIYSLQRKTKKSLLLYGMPLLAGLAMPLGAAIANFEKINTQWLEDEFRHGVMAFGGGALISAVALVLVPEGIEHLDTQEFVGISERRTKLLELVVACCRLRVLAHLDVGMA